MNDLISCFRSVDETPLALYDTTVNGCDGCMCVIVAIVSVGGVVLCCFWVCVVSALPSSPIEWEGSKEGCCSLMGAVVLVALGAGSTSVIIAVSALGA